MSDSISFFVSGIAKPAGSKRGFAIRRGGVLTGQVAITDACKGSADWKRTVAFTARQHYAGPLLQGPLEVTFIFAMVRPKFHFGTGKNANLLKLDSPEWHIARPDVLKCSRAVEDSLTGIIYADDSQIAIEHLVKRYGEKPGVHITIRQLGHPKDNPSMILTEQIKP